MTIQINTTMTADNRIAYAFETRGIEYTVISGYGFNNDEYAIFSNRLNHASRTAPQVMTVAEMAKRSKALRNLATLIAA